MARLQASRIMVETDRPKLLATVLVFPLGGETMAL